MASKIALETAHQFWRELQNPVTSLDALMAFADRAEAAGFDRASIKWLAKLDHAPTQEELDTYFSGAGA